MRYIEAEVLSEEDGSDTELVARESNNETDEITDPTPTKKAKVSKSAVLHVADDNKSTSSKVEEHKSMKPKTAKKESKEKRKSKQKKKEKKGGLLNGNTHYIDCYMLQLKCFICLVGLNIIIIIIMSCLNVTML